MAVYLREADLNHDEATIVDLIQKNLAAIDRSRFSWLYRENPFGPARVWLAIEDQSRQPIGMAAMFPRLAYVAGAQVLGCVLGDFCIDERYRSLGPAVQLQRACLALVQAGQFAFCYDFPSSRMLGVYKYLGLKPANQSVRMVKPLKADATIRQFTPLQGVSGPISKLANLALALMDSRTSPPNNIEYQLDEEPCSTEYQRLADRVGSSLGDCVVRSPDYLNWRYRRHPSQRHEFLAAYRYKELQAYCIFTLFNGQAGIVDLFGTPQQEILSGLITTLVRLLRSRGACTINIAVLTSDSRAGLLKKLGFWSRESVPVISFDPNRRDFGARLSLMHGDRES